MNVKFEIMDKSKFNESNFRLVKDDLRRIITKKEKDKNNYQVTFNNKDITDSFEFRVLDRLISLHSKKIIKLKLLSRIRRNFIDLHDFENRFPNHFKNTLLKVNEKIKKDNLKITILKKDKHWEVVLDDLKYLNKFNINYIKGIYNIIYNLGCGMGLYPKDIKYNLEFG